MFNKFRLAVELIFRERKNLFFVQIGACDGKQSDPIHELIKSHPIWKGILIEPQRNEFLKLKQTYKYRNFVFENLAIYNKNCLKDLYKPRYNLIDKDWKRGIGSLTPHKNFMKEYLKDNSYEMEIVKCITLKKLILKHKISQIDLLQIDAEGFDYEIIRQVMSSKIRPRIIHYEIINLTENEKAQSYILLKKNRYNVIENNWNAIAILED